MVVGHVFGDRGEGRPAGLLDLVEDPQVVLDKVLVDSVDQLGLIVEGEAHFGEAHQGAGKPEKALQGDPDHCLAAGLASSPGAHGVDRLAVIGKKPPAHAEVVVHCGDDALDVVLQGVDRRVGGGKPELLVGVQPEILADVEDAFQLGRKTLPFPVGDGLVPPHGPFPARQPVDGLEIDDRLESLDVVHQVNGLC